MKERTNDSNPIESHVLNVLIPSVHRFRFNCFFSISVAAVLYITFYCFICCDARKCVCTLEKSRALATSKRIDEYYGDNNIDSSGGGGGDNCRCRCDCAWCAFQCTFDANKNRGFNSTGDVKIEGERERKRVAFQQTIHIC